MEPIKFYIGQESGIVVENKDFDKSLFAEQYKQTFEIFNQIWDGQEKEDFRNASNIIAFCGDRGEGKTSLLTSVCEILRNEETYKKAERAKILGDNTWKPEEILALDIIDPLFFDNKHNLIDLLLGQMIVRLEDEERCRQKRENYDVKRVELKNKLIQHFQRAKECLKALNVEDTKSAYDDLENLEDLASGTNLKKELDNLFECYNKYFGTKRLVISVDDLDMNAEGGTNMAIQMRRYLCHSKHCILLVAVKVEQLADIISSSINKYLGDKVVSLETIKEMSHRYVTKLLPLTNRVMMPLGTELVERPLQIIDRNNQASPIRIVKEMVVLLIYQKTFFIFVNNRGLSPIVPTNLRNLRHLIGELYAMPDAEKDNDKINNANKQIFKQYLYYVWTKGLTTKHQKGLKEIVENEDVLSINKMVVAFLCKVLNFSSITNDLSEADSKMIEGIINPYNQIYNVSLGDVYYLIHRAEQTLTDKETLNILFFIKAFYSIKLYELYDIITSNQSLDTISDNKSLANVFNLDTALKGTNILQRFLNGGYFTYAPGAIIPLENGVSRDLRIIDTFKLREMFGSLRDNENNVENLNLCEFFALTTTSDLKQRDVDTLFDRTKYGPLYIREHTTTNNYLLFDVLSIFYNIVNIEETYKRFNKWCGDKDFYEIAKSNPGSLLRQMFDKCTKGELISNHIEPDMHGLLSSAVIRVSDVQQSIEENGYSKREKHGVGGNAKNLYWIYKDIIDLKMHLYPILADAAKNSDLAEETNSNDGLWKKKGHQLTFKFLEPIINLLDAQDKKGGKLFDEIFVSTISLKTNIAPEADMDDIAKLDSVFGQALKEISIKFPQKGNAILITLFQEFPYVYNYLGGKQFIETLINPTKDYNLVEVYNALSPYTSNVEKAFKKYLKAQEKERNKEELLKKEKEEQERKKRELEERKLAMTLASKEQMNKDKLNADVEKQKAILVSKERQKQAELDLKLKKEEEKTKQIQAQTLIKNDAINRKDIEHLEKRIADKVIEMLGGISNN